MIRAALKILVYWCLILLAFILLRQIPFTNASENINQAITFCEILPNPDGSDTKDNEYFKLANSTSIEAILAGWKVCNISNDCYALKEIIPANSCLKIPRSAFIFTLHNDKEELFLYDQNASVVDKITTGAAPSGKAWQCLDSICAWGTPQENCDYSFLIPEDDTGPPDNTNSNDNSSETNQNDNVNAPVASEQSNSNKSLLDIAAKNKLYSIKKSSDFTRLRKILRKKSLVSMLVNIKGVVALPPGLMAKTYFYLSFKDQLIKTHIYSSCQNSPSCLRDIGLEQGKKLDIQAAALKLIDGRFEFYLDKNTQIKEGGKKKFKKTEVEPDIKKQVGKVIRVSGIIVAKKGDYFFVEDAKSKNIISVYISKPLQNAYSKKYDFVPLGYFPFYQATIPNKIWINSSIDASGVVEAVDQEYRIVAYEIKKLQPASNQPTEKKSVEKSASVSSGLRPEPDNSAIAEKKEQPKSEETKEVKNETSKPNREQLKTILAQNLSWKSLWSIFVSKLSYKVYMFRKYF